MNPSISASLLTSLLENSPLAMGIVNREDMSLIYANSIFYRYLGYPADTATRYTVYELWPEQACRIERILDSVCAADESVEIMRFSSTVTDEAGYSKEAYVRYTAKPARISYGDVSDSILIFGEEITPEVFAEHQRDEPMPSARVELTELSNIIENLDEGVAIINSRGEFTVVNPAFYRIHGFTEKEITDKRADMAPVIEQLSVFDLEGNGVLPSDRPFYRIAREEFSEVELRVFRVDSGRTWIGKYSGIRICDTDGKMFLGIIFLRDITTEKEAEMRMNQLLRSKDMFLSMASHEIKTPLTVLSGGLQVLSLHFNQMELDNRTNLMEKIITQCRKLNRLVDDLLDISRLATGHLRIRTAPEDIGSIVEGVALEQKKACTTHDIEVISIVHKTVSCDSGRMDQVLNNLIVNAIKYSPPGTRIDISMTLDGNWVVIAVKDYGIGISSRDLPHIFDQYYRSASGQSEPTGGMGLGLFISKEIVRLHGGDIRVISERGLGSTFTVRLRYYN